LLLGLNIDKGVGDTLETQHCQQIMDYCCQALEAIALGNSAFFSTTLGQQLEQVAYQAPRDLPRSKITFSGGVGELLYQHMAGEALPSTTFYGDFGIDLALAIAASPNLSADMYDFVPENRGRATVYGLTLHSTEISGTTLFLPQPDCLPLNDVPIVSKLMASATSEQWQAALLLAMRREQGACIQIVGDVSQLNTIRALGQRIALSLIECSYPANQPLVILVAGNIGKALGNYATNWTKYGLSLLVIDEVPIRNAHFVNIGRVHQQIVPISFFGLH
jgi:ethanolamine utilization protein EutA